MRPSQWNCTPPDIRSDIRSRLQSRTKLSTVPRCEAYSALGAWDVWKVEGWESFSFVASLPQDSPAKSTSDFFLLGCLSVQGRASPLWSSRKFLYCRKNFYVQYSVVMEKRIWYFYLTIRYFLFLALFGTSQVVGDVSAQTNSPVAHYPFEDGTAVDSVGGHHGSFGDTVTSITGRIGDAILVSEAEGGVSFEFPWPDSTGEGWTMCMWFRINQSGLVLLGSSPTLGVGSTIALVSDAEGALYAGLLDNTEVSTTSDTIVDDGSWHHWCLIGAESSLGMVLDGSEHRLLTDTWTNPGWLDQTAKFQLSPQLNLDDLVVFDRALGVEDIEALYKPASLSLPVSEDFSADTLPREGWSYSSTNEGVIEIVRGTGARLTDSTNNNKYSLNEMVLHVNLEGQKNVVLQFDHVDLSDEEDTLPDVFSNSQIGDGVSISSNGVDWVTVHTWTKKYSNTTELGIVIPLDQYVEAHDILSYNADFRIKFQQYDNYSLTHDGRIFNGIRVFSEEPTPPTFPVSEDFSADALPTGRWAYKSSGKGVIELVKGVGARLTDYSKNGKSSRSEMVLQVDLAGQTNVMLQFDHVDQFDKENPLPDVFINSRNGDGVSVSSNGVDWVTVHTWGGNWESSKNGILISLDDFVKAHDILSYNADFRIKFQRYVDYSYSSYDGRIYGDIRVFTPVERAANRVFVETGSDGYRKIFSRDLDGAVNMQHLLFDESKDGAIEPNGVIADQGTFFGRRPEAHHVRIEYRDKDGVLLVREIEWRDDLQNLEMWVARIDEGSRTPIDGNHSLILWERLETANTQRSIVFIWGEGAFRYFYDFRQQIVQYRDNDSFDLIKTFALDSTAPWQIGPQLQ